MTSPTTTCRLVPARLALPALLASALAVACSSANSTRPASADGGGTAGAGGNGALPRVELTDEMNYVFHSALSAVTTPVQANRDVAFDWSTATVDMMGRTFDPLADVDMMQLMLWRYDKAAFLASINREELDTGRLVAMGYCDAQHLRTHCRFSDLLAPAGSPIAPEKLLKYVDPAIYSPSEHVWVIMLATGRVFGRGTRLLAFFQPSDGETNDQVHLTTDSTTLSYTVDLASLKPIALPRNVGDVVLSWSEDSPLTRTALGGIWIPTFITDVVVAHYLGYEVADLEQRFLLLRDLASEQYAARLSAGQELALSRLTNEAGSPFPGVDDTGIWLFTLNCSSCRNPAPWFLSILRPRD
jgi:hypothetical protein